MNHLTRPSNDYNVNIIRIPMHPNPTIVLIHVIIPLAGFLLSFDTSTHNFLTSSDFGFRVSSDSEIPLTLSSTNSIELAFWLTVSGCTILSSGLNGTMVGEE
ncbi:unnamed protein product [Vicia faba]|uniref:Uncharacterized protein n=1 Tax=Vicia faba TaxID=3906 RepID=A0AAV1AN35_VICFA|nr:unnamed protein product [Vicia faba]